MHKLVLLRHGQSEWNLTNRFTGWTDVGLTEQGVGEARRAGELLAAESLDLDLSFTSLLVRSIRTLELALEVMGRSWIPVERSWRLNERHYGALQGLDKAETAAEHGEEQVQLWRRSYDIRPPKLELDDPRHPAHDERYSHLDRGDLPAAESLADVVARLLPFWNERIAPAIRSGRTVVVSAHGNSLRAMVKHLDGVSDDDIVGLNIPTGIPLVYDLDDDLSPLGHRYLGDPEAAAAAARAVAEQGRAARDH